MTGCLFGILRYFTLMQLVYAYKVQTITQMTSLFWFQSFLYYDEPTKNEQFVFRHQMKLYLKDHVTSVWWNPNTDLAKTTFCLGQRLRVRLAWFEALKVEYQSLSFKSSISVYHLELRFVWKIYGINHSFQIKRWRFGSQKTGDLSANIFCWWPQNDSDMFTFKLDRSTIRRYLRIENERLTLIFLVRPE